MDERSLRLGPVGRCSGCQDPRRHAGKRMAWEVSTRGGTRGKCMAWEAASPAASRHHQPHRPPHAPAPRAPAKPPAGPCRRSSARLARRLLLELLLLRLAQCCAAAAADLHAGLVGQAEGAGPGFVPPFVPGLLCEPNAAAVKPPPALVAGQPEPVWGGADGGADSQSLWVEKEWIQAGRPCTEEGATGRSGAAQRNSSPGAPIVHRQLAGSGLESKVQASTRAAAEVTQVGPAAAAAAAAHKAAGGRLERNRASRAEEAVPALTLPPGRACRSWGTRSPPPPPPPPHPRPPPPPPPRRRHCRGRPRSAVA